MNGRQPRCHRKANLRKHETVRSITPLLIAAFLVAVPVLKVRAQSFASRSVLAATSAPEATESLPDAPVPDSPEQPASGSIQGTVMDPNGAVVPGAHVTLDNRDAKAQRETLSDDNGFFNFTAVGPGRFRVTIASRGFEPWVGPEIVLQPGGSYEQSKINLRVASANFDVEAISSTYELAEEQIKVEEKQRVLGVIPNFYTSYVWNAAPLTSGQKFRLALRTSVDPISFVGAGVTAGIEQWQNYMSGYGQGSEGYAKRFGASYADGFIGAMIGGAILPSVLHQDPRYFYKGSGSIMSRALYAISTVAICKGDNGRWQPNYSNVLGNLASAGISNIYYPASDRNSARVTIDNALIGTAEGAGAALIQEFLLKKISRGTPPSPGKPVASPPPGTQPPTQ